MIYWREAGKIVGAWIKNKDGKDPFLKRILVNRYTQKGALRFNYYEI